MKFSWKNYNKHYFNNMRKKQIAIATALFIPITVMAWQLSPTGTTIERSLSGRTATWYEKLFSSTAIVGVSAVGDSVHEEITNRTLGCNGPSEICGSPDHDPDNAYVIAGVRWNDDPPFKFSGGEGNFKGCKVTDTVRLATQPACWLNVFKSSEALAATGKRFDGSNATMLVRSHFGDMQFLHSMASIDNETPEVTKQKIMAWSEFTWKVALRGYQLDQQVYSLPFNGFDSLFKYNKGWRVQDLFALGNPQIRHPERIDRVAFGSLLHVVQDSFASGHVERLEPVTGKLCPNSNLAAPGKIIEFHSYSGQDHKKHGEGDKRGSFEKHYSAISPGAIDVGQQLYEMFKSKKTWDVVGPYLDCVFAVDEQATKSSPGIGYKK